MVGNDIIDISRCRLTSDWQRKGFLQKVFAPEEQESISSSSDPFTTLWRMWSMKESAYKLYLQQGNERFFNPSKFHCSIQSPEKGHVYIDALSLTTHTEITSGYIFTYAGRSELHAVESRIFHLPRDDYRSQSRLCHQKILQHIAAKSQLPIDQLEIRKTASHIPEIYHLEQKLPLSFSLSHDGNYGAFSVLSG